MNQFQAVINYGIDPHEAENSILLKNKPPAPTSMLYLREWYEKVGINGAKAAFRITQLFESDSFRELSGFDSIKKLSGKNADHFFNIAVKIEDLSLMDLWLKAGANINNSLNGFSPLSLAIKTNNQEVIEKVIMSGAILHNSYKIDKPDCLKLINLTHYFKIAIEQENDLALKNLIKFSPKLLKQKIDGLNPLVYSMLEQKTALVR